MAGKTNSDCPGKSCHAHSVTMLTDSDPARAARVMQAMLTMSKIDIARLQQAYESPVPPK